MHTATSNTTTHTAAAGSSNVPTIVKILPCDRLKDPWENFNYVLMSDGKKKAQCKHCLSIMSAYSNSTLKAQIKQKYCKALKNVPEAGQSSMARDGNAQGAFKYSFQGLWQYYLEKYGNPTPSVNATSSSSRSSYRENPIQGLLQKLRENPNKRAKSDRLQNNEYTRYTGTNFISYPLEIEGGVYEVEVQEGTIELLSDEEIREDEAANAARSVDDESKEEIYE
ncbi:hypothetical protein CTI12_AA624950 [Artemisia annua]|uniref:BED-type domain-containing protein n=1 Tax=Artemisia annua TaxID=35608 RepID=A0A2U1KAN9_ARTAN|nr:hypothetical protein CTI12_AA624950 [Artemisia annua]